MSARRSPGRLGVVVMVDRFPVLSETFVANEVRALLRAGHRVRVEAAERETRPNPEAADLPATYLDGDGLRRRLRDLAWLVTRHPLRCAADLWQRRRWRREEWVRPLRVIAPAARRLAGGGEQHLHAHFAAGAALDALRLGRLLDRPFSVTAHAYDIFLRPANLVEKLSRAAFATSGCDYNVRYLRGLVAPQVAGRIHRVVMGVDASRWARRRPHPERGHVLAVGRLVEKKGFDDLVGAAGLLAERDTGIEVRIVGDGPLAEPLRAQAAQAGAEAKVCFEGALPPAAIRDLLEDAAVLAMPCVVAPDGDRDSMPVVVKEALAAEVPVVVTDEVGLPELVRPQFGRLVPPRDPQALAEALLEVVSAPAEERARMGAAGRDHVIEHADVDRETARLAELIDAASAAHPRGRRCAVRPGS